MCNTHAIQRVDTGDARKKPLERASQTDLESAYQPVERYSAFDMLRALALPVYVPCILIDAARSTATPSLPLFLRTLGCDDAQVGLILGCEGAGETLGGLPASSMLRWLGERSTMVVALAAVGLFCLSCAFVSTGRTGLSLLLPLLGIAAIRFCIGAGVAAFQVARWSYLSHAVEPNRRGLATSSLGGMMRLGSALGALLSGVLVNIFSLAAPFAAQPLILIGAVLLIGAFVPASKPVVQAAHAPTHGRRTLSWAVLRPTLQMLPMVLAVSVARASRSLLLPLVAAQLGVPPLTLGSIMSLSFGVDLLTFPFGGILTDGYGRKHSGLSSLCCFAISFFALATASTETQLWQASALLGLSNGLSAGILQTVGQDLAPAEGRAEFFGMWKMVLGTGPLLGPPALGAISAAYGQPSAAAYAVAAATAIGAALYAFFAEETLVRAKAEVVSTRRPDAKLATPKQVPLRCQL